MSSHRPTERLGLGEPSPAQLQSLGGLKPGSHITSCDFEHSFHAVAVMLVAPVVRSLFFTPHFPLFIVSYVVCTHSRPV